MINVTLILTLTCFVQTAALMKISDTQLLSKDSNLKFYSWQNAALLVSSAELFCSSTQDKQHCARAPLGNSAFLSPQAHCRETSAQSTHWEPCAGIPWKHWPLAWKATKEALSQNEERDSTLTLSFIFKWRNWTTVNCSYK